MEDPGATWRLGGHSRLKRQSARAKAKVKASQGEAMSRPGASRRGRAEGRSADGNKCPLLGCVSTGCCFESDRHVVESTGVKETATHTPADMDHQAGSGRKAQQVGSQQQPAKNAGDEDSEKTESDSDEGSAKRAQPSGAQSSVKMEEPPEPSADIYVADEHAEPTPSGTADQPVQGEGGAGASIEEYHAQNIEEGSAAAAAAASETTEGRAGTNEAASTSTAPMAVDGQAGRGTKRKAGQALFSDWPPHLVGNRTGSKPYGPKPEGYRSLFLKDVPRTASVDDVKAALRCPADDKVEDILFFFDEQTNERHDFALVDFATEEDCMDVGQIDDITIGGRRIWMQWASFPKPAPRRANAATSKAKAKAAGKAKPKPKAEAAAEGISMAAALRTGAVVKFEGTRKSFADDE
ncbi:unnamed protein product [Vitrella brassicaformis CCMP3155]|uniref:RRM domain-containing protein n=1 Tax=Vitrella brassicaformis (strain CCMP3155) TaxID=1169540 RepID=A0A0G4GX93_VITBC|nr:unnamed protein product [Vitrella brassicaformis CCMP3155]|eukprot:CEM35696.1 unnamed protein product [Vitrella brassicaformis CCMP3155]